MINLIKRIYFELLVTFDPEENDLYTQMGEDYWKIRI